MSDFTPTTEQVRETYSALCKTDAAATEFDRWLAVHDAELREQIARELIHDLPIGTVIRADRHAYVHTDAWEWVETVTGTASTADELTARHTHWHAIHTPGDEAPWDNRPMNSENVDIIVIPDGCEITTRTHVVIDGTHAAALNPDDAGEPRFDDAEMQGGPLDGVIVKNGGTRQELKFSIVDKSAVRSPSQRSIAVYRRIGNSSDTHRWIYEFFPTYARA